MDLETDPTPRAAYLLIQDAQNQFLAVFNLDLDSARRLPAVDRLALQQRWDRFVRDRASPAQSATS